MTATASAPQFWWGKYRLNLGQHAFWQIGPLRLDIQRFQQEIRVSHDEDGVWTEDSGPWRFESEPGETRELEHTDRFIFSSTRDELELLPALADRPVVSRPVTPLALPAGEETTLYISTPLWLQLRPAGSDKVFFDIPIQRPSDTWFGHSTREGELCYASRTLARLRLEEVQARPHRAITPLVIINRSETPLVFERLNLPAPFLSIFADGNGTLWTEPVTMKQEEDEETASLEVGRHAPAQAPGARLIASPRKQGDKAIWHRAFSAVFD